MLKDSMAKLLSEQVTAEYYSAYLYQAMSAWADGAGWKGISHWLFLQAKEELEHGIRIYQHIIDRGALPAFGAIQAPEISFNSVADMFEKIANHERQVTELINNIADFALSEKDHATYGFIQWFIKEQIEEESVADEIFWKVKFAGDNSNFLFILDAQLGGRDKD